MRNPLYQEAVFNIVIAVLAVGMMLLVFNADKIYDYFRSLF